MFGQGRTGFLRVQTPRAAGEILAIGFTLCYRLSYAKHTKQTLEQPRQLLIMYTIRNQSKPLQPIVLGPFLERSQNHCRVTLLHSHRHARDPFDRLHRYLGGEGMTCTAWGTGAKGGRVWLSPRSVTFDSLMGGMREAAERLCKGPWTWINPDLVTSIACLHIAHGTQGRPIGVLISSCCWPSLLSSINLPLLVDIGIYFDFDSTIGKDSPTASGATDQSVIINIYSIVF